MSPSRGNASTKSRDGGVLTGCLCAGVVVVGCGAVAALAPDATEAVRMAIRLTARTSLLLFLVAFTASSLDRLWPSAATRWTKANRRSFGLSFAFSHAVHAAAIVALSQVDSVLFDALTAPAAFVAGGVGYLVIALMTATSFDRISALVGPRVRSVIHGGGAWFLALFFVVNFGRRAVLMPEMYWPYMALLFAAIAVRVAARLLRPDVRAAS